MISNAEARLSPFDLPERIGAYFERPYEGTKPPKEILQWRGYPPTMVLMGPNGTGKTRLAAAFFRRVTTPEKKKHFHYRDRPHPLWWQTDQFVAAIREEFQEPIRSVMRHAEDTSFLVLDDLGGEREKVTDFYVEQVAGLLTYRWDRRKYTIVTCNWTVAEWRRFSPRLASRFLGREGLHLVMKGRDRRQELLPTMSSHEPEQEVLQV